MSYEDPATEMLSGLTDEEIEFLSSIEGKNRHVSRALAKSAGYTWSQVQDMRRRYLTAAEQL